MPRRPLRRLTATIFVVMSLLFSQLALANYVCPARTDTLSMAATMAEGGPCEGMDQAQPTLCHQHCAESAQSFEAVKQPPAWQPVVAQMLVVPLVLDADRSVAAPIAATPQARPPPEPLFLATLRLRV